MGYENWEQKINNYNQFDLQQPLKKLAHPSTIKPYPTKWDKPYPK